MYKKERESIKRLKKKNSAGVILFDENGASPSCCPTNGGAQGCCPKNTSTNK